MKKHKKGFKRRLPGLPRVFLRLCSPDLLVIFWVVLFLIMGCGGAINKERTLRKDGLTITYRSVNRISPDIDNMPLQHPARISRNIIQTHLLSLQFWEIGSRSKKKSIFTPEDGNKMSRLLAKALNRARRDRYVHFEFDAAKGRTSGEIFTGNNKVHWVFTTINGVDYSNDPLGIRKKTWKLAPQKGQSYYLVETDFGKKARENWIVADFQLPKPGQSPAAIKVRTETALRENAKATEKRKLLQFLKHLYDNGLIHLEEYQREKKELMKKMKN